MHSNILWQTGGLKSGWRGPQEVLHILGRKVFGNVCLGPRRGYDTLRNKKTSLYWAYKSLETERTSVEEKQQLKRRKTQKLFKGQVPLRSN